MGHCPFQGSNSDVVQRYLSQATIVPNWNHHRTIPTKFVNTSDILEQLQTKHRCTCHPNLNHSSGTLIPHSRSRVTALGRRPISSHCFVIARTLGFQTAFIIFSVLLERFLEQIKSVKQMFCIANFYFQFRIHFGNWILKFR